MKRGFKKGDIVWGQSNGQPIWPAQVIKLVKQVVFELPDDELYEVNFFNDNSKAVLRGSMMHDFLKYQSRYERHLQKRNFKQAVRLAEEKAKKMRDRAASSSLDFSKDNSRLRKREQTPSPNISKRKKEITEQPHEVENVRVLPVRTSRRERTPSPVTGKRKRTSAEVDKPKKKRRFEERQDTDSLQSKKGRKKLKREQPPHTEAAEPVVQSVKQRKVDPQLVERLKSKLLDHQTEPITDAFKQLRRRVDSVTTKLFTTSEGDLNRVSEETLQHLEEILKLLKQSTLKTQDLMATRTSNMLVFIAKTLSKREECKTLVAQIIKEISRMKESLIKEFEATEKYDAQLEELRQERALAEAEAQVEEID